MFRQWFALSAAVSALPRANRTGDGGTDSADFHFCRLFPGDHLSSSLIRHEHYLYARLCIKPGQKALHVGSGSGIVALELVRFANVSVIGVDVDPENVRRANRLAEEHSLTSKMRFIHVSDYSDLRPSLPLGTFDFVFAIESLKNAGHFADVYRELCSYLKPGGRLGIYEWCWSASFDADDPDHCRLAEVFETSLGLPTRQPYDRSIPAAIDALTSSGMQVMVCDDLSNRQDLIPWYSTLTVTLSNDSAPWSSHRQWPRGLTQTAASIMAESARLKLFTPMLLLVAQKHE